MLTRTQFFSVSVITLMAVASIAMGFHNTPPESFEQKRSRVLKELSSSIEDARVAGNYACCIDPPCDMCYLGHWLWPDGICRCDEMIAKGEFDKVCPQCQRGIEEGKCSSTTETSCEI
jgi:hypothetical protein